MKEVASDTETFQLQCVIEESINNFKLHELYRGIKLQRVDDLVEPLTLTGNKQILKEVLILLMSTAVEFVGATCIMISVKQLLQTEKEVLLEFAISDDGGRVLEEAGHTQFSYKRRLSAARTILEQHGGRAEINSLYGVGTTFKFLLKFVKQTAIEPGKDTRKNLSGKKILVADDNELNQKIIAHLLKKEGMQVDIANDGREALDLYENNKDYDIVLLDLQMPHVDGFQAANYMRRKLNSLTPIIALTAGFYPDADTRCLEVGFNECIHKPLKPNELLDTIYQFFE